MEIRRILWTVVFSSIVMGVFTVGCGVREFVRKPMTAQNSLEKIAWQNSLDEGFKLAQVSKKPLMVDFYADWCGWCHKLDNTTYADAEVVKLSKNFICVKVNTGQDSDSAAQYGVRGLPSIFFLNYEGKILEKVDGYRDEVFFKDLMAKIK